MCWKELGKVERVVTVDRDREVRQAKPITMLQLLLIITRKGLEKEAEGERERETGSIVRGTFVARKS